ncbi:putative transcriptional regulator [Clostridium acetobutylicum]|nr:putative transcriptional regulator [Clostridium acetobutylicum]
MFEDTLELAENKLLLLYILHKLEFPISKNQFTEIILENNFMNYFILQQYISELISSNFVKSEQKDNKHSVSITHSGTKVLNLFINRLSIDKKDLIDKYISSNLHNIKML